MKKTKLFTFSRETEINYVNTLIKDVNKREILYDMIDSVIEINEKDEITFQELEPFITGLEEGDKFVWSVASDRLVELSQYYEEAAQTIKVLAKDKKSRIRYRVIASLDGEPPFHLAIEILHDALKDKSKKVRIKAAEMIYQLKLEELYDSLRTQLKLEKNIEVKETLQFYLERLDK